MGTVKQFTLRFDTEIPAEKEIMEHLKTRAEQLGISRNTFLLRLLREDMERGSAAEDLGLDPDAAIERIVSGVAERLAGVITEVRAAGMETDAGDGGTYYGNRKSMAAAYGEEREVLSEDAMEFLSGF